MPSNLDLPIIDLEGIGPHIATALGELGVKKVGDLLRLPSQALHAAVDKLASPKQARSWRQMACFLEIPAMTPQWAEALVWRDIYTHADLCRTSYAELSEHFEAAKNAKRISTVPEPPALAAILTGAATLANIGAVTGTLVTEDIKRVAGAEIKIGKSSTVSDERGRFRISGLPLRQKLLLVATHNSKGAVRAAIEAVRTEAAVVSTFTLKQDSIPYRRSELQGQRLPKILGYPLKATEVAFDSIAKGDLLKVILFYADGKHVKLTSKLLDFEDGEVQVHWSKAPLDALPPDLKLHDHLLKRASGWRKVTMNRLRLRSYKRMLRVTAQFRGRAAPTSFDERKALYDEVVTELLKAKAL